MFLGCEKALFGYEIFSELNEINREEFILWVFHEDAIVTSESVDYERRQ